MVDQFGFTLPPGSHAWPKFRVKLDTLNQVAESNELNNEKIGEATSIHAGAVPIPKIYSTHPAGVLVLDMATWQSPFGWPFSICANESVKTGWETWVTLNGAPKNTPMVWYASIPPASPACPAGLKRSYWVVLDGQPAPGDYQVKLGPQQPGVVTVPLTLRVPGVAYQQRFLKPPIRPN